MATPQQRKRPQSMWASAGHTRHTFPIKQATTGPLSMGSRRRLLHRGDKSQDPTGGLRAQASQETTSNSGAASPHCKH
eukprot:2559824-Pyramimonas_sp.AAC.1